MEAIGRAFLGDRQLGIADDNWRPFGDHMWETCGRLGDSWETTRRHLGDYIWEATSGKQVAENQTTSGETKRQQPGNRIWETSCKNRKLGDNWVTRGKQ